MKSWIYTTVHKKKKSKLKHHLSRLCKCVSAMTLLYTCIILFCSCQPAYVRPDWCWHYIDGPDNENYLVPRPLLDGAKALDIAIHTVEEEEPDTEFTVTDIMRDEAKCGWFFLFSNQRCPGAFGTSRLVFVRDDGIAEVFYSQ